ncbi:MAG: heavy-metal-associated domain-containing protein [Prolixibacteraceae bacterium]|jgi:mercuric ion binding protein|nr:heavy-metal-associated domain-containing protein [Prolixibacteraceae bacterium]
MKTKKLSILMMFLLAATLSFAGNKKDTLKVYGNCGMCETRIEKAANAVEGFSEALWDKETLLLTVEQSNDKADIMKVHKAVAKVGHDTNKAKADDKVYNKLPGCCKYERPENKEE